MPAREPALPTRAGARPQRTAGGEQLEAPGLVDFLQKLRRNTREFDADGRVLRLKRYVSAVATPAVLDAVLDALAVNTRVEVLYIQNFERGFTDAQLRRLTQARARSPALLSSKLLFRPHVLKLRRIWALNVGENFTTTLPAWRAFAAALPQTNVQYMYASEHHFLRTDLKVRMRDAIRVNRKAQRTPHDPAVVRCVGNMWYNPKVGAGGEGAGRACSAKRDGGGGGGGAERRRASSPVPAAAGRRRAASPTPARVMLRRPGKRTLVLTPRAAAAQPARGSAHTSRRTAMPPHPQKTRTSVAKRRLAEEEEPAAATAAAKRPRRTITAPKRST